MKNRIVARYLQRNAVLWSEWMKDQPVEHKRLYHASPIQDLTEITSGQGRYQSDGEPLIFGTDNKGYAAGFTFPWYDEDGIVFGYIEDEDFFTLEIPKEKKHLLYDKPCSIYTIEGDFKKAQEYLPEWATTDEVTIIAEEQFENPMAALEAVDNVKVVIKDD